MVFFNTIIYIYIYIYIYICVCVCVCVCMYCWAAILHLSIFDWKLKTKYCQYNFIRILSSFLTKALVLGWCWLVNLPKLSRALLDPLYPYIHGEFNKFPDYFVQAFKILVDSWNFSMLLLYILWDDWLIFIISRSNEQLQQQLEYTLLEPDYHS